MIQTKRISHTHTTLPKLNHEHEQKAKVIIEEWLNDYYGFDADIIQQTDPTSKPKGSDLVSSKDKRAVFVEDSPNEIQALHEKGERVVMLRYEHNSHLINEIAGLPNFSDWSKAPAQIATAAAR